MDLQVSQPLTDPLLIAVYIASGDVAAVLPSENSLVRARPDITEQRLRLPVNLPAYAYGGSNPSRPTER